jgi:hypothetical protein
MVMGITLNETSHFTTEYISHPCGQGEEEKSYSCLAKSWGILVQLHQKCRAW